MTNPITDAQLDEIDARHNAATPGPWGSHRDLDGVYTIQARPRVTCAGMETDGDIATLAAGRTDAESYANARFIGHAREDVPALLAEVRRLRAQLDAVTGLCDAAEKQAARWEHPLPVPEWVAEVRRAVEHGANRPVSA